MRKLFWLSDKELDDLLWLTRYNTRLHSLVKREIKARQ